MNFLENIKTAISNIFGYKMRSTLTMLGIIIGISSVIMINSTGEGVRESIFDAMDGINSSFIQVYPRTIIEETDRLMPEDAYIIGTMDMVDRVSILIEQNGFEIERRDETARRGTGVGLDQNVTVLEDVNIAIGRFITEEDVFNRSRVTVLQADVSFEVFGRLNSVGERITLTNPWGVREEFTIIGVLEELNVDGMMAMASDATPMGRGMFFLPYTTMQDIIGISHIDFFGVALHDGYSSVESAEIISNVLDMIKGTEDRYVVESLEVMFEQIDVVFSAVTGFVALVAGISLFVGGVGVMNIMLVTVKERTREIGIRKSLGATNNNIRLQFVLEAIILCFIGGAIGITLGLLSAMGIGVLLTGFMGTDVSPFVGAFDVAFAFIVSSLVGVVFGVYPANKAAKLDPIEALRYE
ncbi:MAG: ABC transporter permease [Defluviitaleaceae bacterium]|nr:ABC transporter permease [Defluviitaleaceae bacterium]